MTRGTRIALVTGAVALVLDALTKQLVLEWLPIGSRVQVIEGYFQLAQARNPGFVFSFLANAPFVARAAVVLSVTTIVTIIAWRMLRERALPGRLAVALGLVLGGAYGNLIDRIRHGEVVDFLRFHLQHSLAWPTFNLADVFIVVGAGLLVIDALRAPAAAPDEPTAAPDR